ncbi:MAG: penicillin-binding transpeptidase domain-containing protein, partial [Rhodospirillaceae bacterium]
NYHPLRYPEAAIDRRNYVIGRMLDDGYLTEQEAAHAKSVAIEVQDRDETEVVGNADYFAETVRRDIALRYGDDALYKGGLSVRTSLDPRLQAYADQSLRAGLIAYDKRHGWRGPTTQFASGNEAAAQLADVPDPAGLPARWMLAAVQSVQEDQATIVLRDGQSGVIPLAEMRWAREWLPDQKVGEAVSSAAQVLKAGDIVAVESLGDESQGAYTLQQIPEIDGAIVAMDPHTGRVLAMSGGFSFERSQFNRATQALRQPGSAFKPFVYLAALQDDYTPSTLVLDAPFVIDQGPSLPKWKPKNYSGEYIGRATLRTGIEKSQNLMTVRLAQAVGMDAVANVAESFGVVSELPHHLSASLGAEVTTVLDLTTAYAQLANGGKKLDPTFIDRIQDRNGRTIYRADDRPCELCAIQVWDEQQPPQIPDDRPQLSDPASV